MLNNRPFNNGVLACERMTIKTVYYGFRIAFVGFLFWFLSVPTATIWAQGGTGGIAGARGAGMANTWAAYEGLESVWGNASGMVFSPKPDIDTTNTRNNERKSEQRLSAGVFAERRFNIAEIQYTGFGAMLPVGQSGAFGLAVTALGDARYGETKAGFSYARRLAKGFSLGIQLDYLNAHVVDYGTNAALTFEVGIDAHLSKEVRLGAHIYNPTRTRINTTDYLPTVFALSGAYTPNRNVCFTVQFEQDPRYTPTLKAGLEYHILRFVDVRAGVATTLNYASFGVGIHLRRFRLDIATELHQILGLTPCVGIVFR